MTREPKTPSGRSINRRPLLVASGIAAITGYAFRDDIRTLFHSDSETGSTADDAVIDRAVAAHIEYRRNISPSVQRADFTYGRIDRHDTQENESAELIAESTSNNRGDRLVMILPESASAESMLQNFVAYWGASPDNRFAYTTIDDTEVTFLGGAGSGIAVAAATVSFPANEAILAVRATSLDIAQELVTTFEDEMLSESS